MTPAATAAIVPAIVAAEPTPVVKVPSKAELSKAAGVALAVPIRPTERRSAVSFCFLFCIVFRRVVIPQC